MGQNTKNEASKFSKLLLKYTKQKDLCRVPACSARAWLVHIWQDVPSTRPNLDLLVSCVVRWLADPYEMQGQWFKPIPYMHRSQSQGFGLIKRLLNYQFHIFAGNVWFVWLLFGLVLAPPWNLEGVKAACLGILGEETARQSPANAERWIVSLLFQEVDVR